MQPINGYTVVTERCGFVPDISAYGVQYIWKRGRFTGGRGDTVQVPVNSPVPNRQHLAGNYLERQ